MLTKNTAKEVKHQQFECFFQNWVAQQQLDLDELLQTLTNYPNDNDYLQLIAKKVITHFENYNASRSHLAKHDGPSFLAPTWGTTFENSFMWIGGCRPSLMIRLVYALCGSQLNVRFTEFLEGVRHGNLGEISGSQLKGVDDLHAKTVKDEDKLTSHMATLQERVADEPLGLLANNCKKVGALSQSQDEAVGKTMDTYTLGLYDVLLEADKLRLNVLKGIIDILTPLQAVELLVAAKKLHLSLHEWSKRRDIRMGITQLLDTKIPSSSNDPPLDP